MNICARNCKHYEACIPLRYNNLRQRYMTEIEVTNTKDNLPVIYVKSCSKFQRQNGFNRAIGVDVNGARHTQKQKVAREKKLYFEA